MPKPIPDFQEILKVLVNNEVDFIVVGGVCAVIHGAPVTTFDLFLEKLIEIKEESVRDRDKTMLILSSSPCFQISVVK